MYTPVGRVGVDMAKIKVKSITKGTMAKPLVVSTPEPVAVVPTVSPVPSEHSYPPVQQDPLKELLSILPPPPPPPPPPCPCPCPIPPLPRPPHPPPLVPFIPKPCCPSTSQIVDNVTVRSLDEDKIDVIEGSYQGMKAYGIDAKTFAGIGTTGMVPKPLPGDEDKYLRADGEWSTLTWYQSDWDEDNPLSPSYIRNKPVIDTELDADSPNAIANSAVTRAIDDIIERLDNIKPVDDADIVAIVDAIVHYNEGDGEPSINFDNMDIGG